MKRKRATRKGTASFAATFAGTRRGIDLSPKRTPAGVARRRQLDTDRINAEKARRAQRRRPKRKRRR